MKSISSSSFTYYTHEPLVIHLVISISVKVSEELIKFGLCEVMTIFFKAPWELVAIKEALLFFVCFFKADSKELHKFLRVLSSLKNALSDLVKNLFWTLL